MSLIDKTVTISLPTTRVNGAPIVAADIASVSLKQGPSGGPYTVDIGSYAPTNYPGFSVPVTVETDNGNAIVGSVLLVDGATSQLSGELLLPVAPNPPVLS